MYPDEAVCETRLAAAPTAAEVNARVAQLLAARQAAAAMAQEVAVARGAPKTVQQMLLMDLPPPTARATAGGGDAPPPAPPATNTETSNCAQPQNPEEQPDPTEGSCSSQQGSRCWLMRNLFCLGSSFMVLYIAMKGAVNLQSSVFAEVGLGTSGLSAYYTGFLLSNIFLPTITIKYLGCKVTVIVTILMYIPYIAAQLWARFYTLVPGGLLAGLAAGPMWVAQGTYLSHMANVYGLQSGENNEVLMVRLFGIFYMLYQMSQVWGNLVSSAVLSQGETAMVMLNDTRQICGANFCPGSSESTDQLAHGKPASHHIAIITFSYIGCILVAAAIVFFGVDPIPRSQGTSRRDGEGEGEGDNPQEGSSLSPKENETRVCDARYGACEDTERSGGVPVPVLAVTLASSTDSTLALSGRTASQPPVAAGGHGGYSGQSAFQVMKATFKVMANVDLLLLVPVTAFLGVEDTFLAADYTASYVSCAWGISNIGYVMICYGVMNSASALLGGWVVKITGRVPVVLGATVLQTAVVTALRVWQPHPNDATLFFAMAGMWGITDGIWQAQINAMYGILFPGQEEAAYSSFRLWEGVGYILAYSYSSFLCTDSKLYVLLALMLVGVLGYITDEMRLRRRKRVKADPN